MNTRGLIGQIARIRQRVNALIERELKSRGIKGVVPHHSPVLAFLLRQSEPVPIKALVEHVGRAKSSITGTLNTLERHGYIHRTPCETDKRITYVALTEKGKALEQPMQEISAILLDRFYGGISMGDRQQLVELLERIGKNLE